MLQENYPNISVDSEFGVKLINYYGLPICISFKHKSTGEIRKIKLSYRPLAENSRSKKGYGKKAFEREYSPATKTPVYNDSEHLKQVILDTLDDVMPKYFLPALFERFPHIVTDDRVVALVLPYAWHILKQDMAYAASTLVDKERAFRKLMELYCDKSIAYLTPFNVKPDLDDMANTTKKTAEDCASLLDQLFAGALLPFAPTLAKLWESADSLKYTHLYSPELQTRNRLHPPVLKVLQCKALMQRCEAGIKHGHHALRYFMAALMFVTGIGVDEACAISMSCFSPMPNDPARHYLTIYKKVILQGHGKEKHATRVRKPRHTIALIDDITKIRNLPMGIWIDNLFSSISELNPDPALPLLRDPRNKNRFLHPDDFRVWLDREFGDLITNSDPTDVGKLPYYRVDNFLQHTAPSEMNDYGCMREELRHMEGRPPQHTDVIYYADLNLSSELEKLANIQDLWLANILPLSMKSANDKNIIEIPGRPHHIPYAKLRITVPPGTSSEIIAQFLSKFGGKATISSIPYPQVDQDSSSADVVPLL